MNHHQNQNLKGTSDDLEPAVENNNIPNLKMKGICKEQLVPLSNYIYGIPLYGYLEKGEPSCGYCLRCEKAKPLISTLQVTWCGHRFCMECFRDHIAGAFEEGTDQNMLLVKCPEMDCNVKLEYKAWRYFIPGEVYRRKLLAYYEGMCIALMEKITCPFCSNKFIDDQLGYLIRACTNCWKIICTNCMVPWHFGISCREFQFRRMLDIAELLQQAIDEFNT